MDFRAVAVRKPDLCWRKSRLAARLILRARAGKTTARDRRIGSLLKRDPDVTDRLLDQALASITARHTIRSLFADGNE